MPLLTASVPPPPRSCQFALHYSFSSEQRARRALRNISQLLRPGGTFFGTTADANVLCRRLREADGLTFGNEVYTVTFDSRHATKLFPADQPFGLEYRFTLEDAVEDCAEYLVPFQASTPSEILPIQ